MTIKHTDIVIGDKIILNIDRYEEYIITEIKCSDYIDYAYTQIYGYKSSDSIKTILYIHDFYSNRSHRTDIWYESGNSRIKDIYDTLEEILCQS